MALIRCKNCGNLASSRSAICPICGEKINAEQPTTAPDTNSTTPAVESAPAPITEAPTATEQPQPSSQPTQAKTLNDILAERNTTSTLNDTHAEERAEEEQQTKESVVVVPTPMPTPAEAPSNNAISSYDYDDNGRTVEDYEDEIRRRKRTAGGFMVASAVLLLCIAVLGFLLIDQINERKTMEDGLRKALNKNSEMSEMNEFQADMLRDDAEELVAELAKYKDKNDTMAMRYEEALQMLADLESDRNHTLDQLRRYQEEVKTLKGIMKQYVRQIDSLHKENRVLLTENTSMKKEIKSHELRADQAEERADELDTKVRQGAVIQVSAIRLSALKENSTECRRIRQAKRLRVDFELTANALAEPGEKSIYVCITNPDGYPLSSSDIIAFDYEGETMYASAMRKVDYENNRVDVSIFYDGESFSKGTYKVDIYIDGRHCGSGEKYFD